MTALDERQNYELAESELVVGRRIQQFSRLAGPVQPAPAEGESYRVAFRGVDAVHGRGRAVRSLAVATFAFLFELVVFLWVVQPSHRPVVDGGAWAVAANVVVVGSIVLMEFLRVVNVLFIALTSVLARDPVPVEPMAEQRVAFLTTIVPSKEPIDVVRGTLQAALRIRYRGILDVWILDEGDDPAVKAMCRELGVNHFTRKGVDQYNRSAGPFKTKTKHGNYNAWVSEHGEYYDVFLSVDPDHVPLPNYAERILGYFRDPDVAFVSAPQCYANDESFVTRAAEAQQFIFHSLIQRAANRFNVGMLVGTNNAIRLDAFRQVDGLSDSVTEDLATGLKFHARRNPTTGHRWKSVYTPDVLAVGEGPSSWGDFFSQQMRWSRGTFDVIIKDFWRRLPRLSPGGVLHYLLLATFYPSMALGWLFGAVNACLFLTLGVKGIVVPVQLWFALYVDAAAIQLWLYLRNRRYNVSPYEAEGSSGLKGMLMSTISAPIYAASFLSSLARLPAKFVVTPKGVSSSQDTLYTFRRHLQWGALLVVAVIVAVFLGYAQPPVLMWPAVMLFACLLPPVTWVVERVVGRRPALEAVPVADHDGHPTITTEKLERAALDALIAEGSTTPSRSPLSVPFPAVLTGSDAHRVPAGAPSGRGPTGPEQHEPGPQAGRYGHGGRDGSAPPITAPPMTAAPAGTPGSRPAPSFLPAAAGTSGTGRPDGPGAPLPRGWMRQGPPPGSGVGPGERYRTQAGPGPRPNGPTAGPPGLAGPGPRVPRHGAPTGATPTVTPAPGSGTNGTGRHTSAPAGPTPDDRTPASPWTQRNVPLPPTRDDDESRTAVLPPVNGNGRGADPAHTPGRPAVGDDQGTDRDRPDDESSEHTSTVAVRVVALAAVARPAAPTRPAAAPEVVGPRARPGAAVTGAGPEETEAS